MHFFDFHPIIIIGVGGGIGRDCFGSLGSSLVWGGKGRIFDCFGLDCIFFVIVIVSFKFGIDS